MLRLDGHAIPDHLANGVAALGNFDGFHLGHQAVVGRAVARARAANVAALVGTFDPHPARYFKPDLPPMALTTLDQRLDLLAAAGVDATVVWRFDAAFAAVTPAAFLAEHLAARLRVQGVVTGWDFTYGARRGGDTAALAHDGPPLGIMAEALSPIEADAAPISSTRIRAALAAGRPGDAAALLGRPFTIAGPVIAGARLGRELGFPTANMALGDYVRPAYGVYAVRARLADGRLIDGVANLGIRPMIEPPLELLETHLLDFSGDLYGATLAIELHHYLRPEWKLDTLAALTAQVEADKAHARRLLSTSPLPSRERVAKP